MINKNKFLLNDSDFMLKSRNGNDMFSFKISDLVFLSKLDLTLELTAFQEQGKKANKSYWTLHIKAEHSGFSKEGFLHGARGEIRKFSQLNALVDICKQYIKGCNELKIKFN